MVSKPFLNICEQVMAIFLACKVTIATVKPVKNTSNFTFKWL